MTFQKSVKQFMSEFITPLHEKNIVQFSHGITFGKNQITSIGSSTEITTYFNKKKMPIFCSDEFGRKLDEGIYINQILESTYHECAALFPILHAVGKKLGLNYGKNSLHIFEKDKYCQHLYTLYFDLEENNFIQWSLNNGQFISDLLSEYKMKAKDLILEGQDIQNRSMRIPFSQFNLSEFKNNHTQKKLAILHNHLKIPIHLSHQQSKCLLLHIKGKTAKAIANELNISTRTVESYLNTIKKMTGCASGKELIRLYYDSQII